MPESLTWDAESDWDDAQDTEDVEIDGGTFLLAVASNLTHIETQEADDDSSIDFTEVFASDDGYDRYIVYADNYLPVVNDRRLEYRFSSDGGSTWDDGDNDYTSARFAVHEDGTTGSGGDTLSSGYIIPFVGNDASKNDLGNMSMVISDPTDSDRATVVRHSPVQHRDSEDPSFRVQMSGGIRNTQSAIDSIRFFAEGSDNIDSGIFSVYGVSQ